MLLVFFKSPRSTECDPVCSIQIQTHTVKTSSQALHWQHRLGLSMGCQHNHNSHHLVQIDQASQVGPKSDHSGLQIAKVKYNSDHSNSGPVVRNCVEKRRKFVPTHCHSISDHLASKLCKSLSTKSDHRVQVAKVNLGHSKSDHSV